MTTPCFFASFCERVGARPGDRLGQLEEAMVLDLAEVLRAEQLLRADDLRALVDGRPRQRELPGQVGLGIGSAGHLREADVDDSAGRRGNTAGGGARTSRRSNHVDGFVIACGRDRPVPPMNVHLIDGTYELFRHFYAVPAARDATGSEVGAVRGVLASVLAHARRRRHPRRRRHRPRHRVVPQRALARLQDRRGHRPGAAGRSSRCSRRRCPRSASRSGRWSSSRPTTRWRAAAAASRRRRRGSSAC